MADTPVWRNLRNSVKNDGLSEYSSVCNGALKYQQNFNYIESSPGNLSILKTLVGYYYTVESEEIVRKDIYKDLVFLCGIGEKLHSGYLTDSVHIYGYNTFTNTQAWYHDFYYLNPDPGNANFADVPILTMIKQGAQYRVLCACNFQFTNDAIYTYGFGIGRRMLTSDAGGSMSPLISYGSYQEIMFIPPDTLSWVVMDQNLVNAFADDSHYGEINNRFVTRQRTDILGSPHTLYYSYYDIDGYTYTETFENPDESLNDITNPDNNISSQRVSARGSTHFAAVYYDLDTVVGGYELNRFFGIFLISSSGTGPVYFIQDDNYLGYVSCYHNDTSNQDWFYIYRTGEGLESYNYSGLRWADASISAPSGSMAIWEFDNGEEGEDQVITPIIIGITSGGTLWAQPDSDPGTPGYEWSVITGYSNCASPIVDKDGDIIFAHSGGVACYNIFGVSQWNYTGHVPSGSLAIGSNGDVLFMSGNTLIALTDGTAPDVFEVEETSPEQDATSVANDTTITIKFTSDLQPTTITSSSLIIKDEDDNELSYSTSYDGGTYTLTITPNSILPTNNDIEVWLTTGVANTDGTTLAETYILKFTTATLGLDEVDLIPPSPITKLCKAENTRFVFKTYGPSVPASKFNLHFYAYSYNDAGGTSLIESKDTINNRTEFEVSTDLNSWTPFPVAGVGEEMYGCYIRVTLRIPRGSNAYVKMDVGAEDA